MRKMKNSTPLNISHCSFHDERCEENCWFLWGCGAVLCNRWVQIALSNEQNHLGSSCSRIRSLHTGKQNSQQQQCWRIPRDADTNWRMAWNWFRMANGKRIFPFRYSVWEFWTTFQDVPFILEKFRLGKPKQSYHWHPNRIFRDFSLMVNKQCFIKAVPTTSKFTRNILLSVVCELPSLCL